MERTAIIFNAGVGAITLAFQREGYEILAAYEPDEKAVDIYKMNIDGKVYPSALRTISESDIPEADLFVANIFKGFSTTRHYTEDRDDLSVFSEIISTKRPKAFCILTNPSLRMNRAWEPFLKEKTSEGYNISYSLYDVQSLTGFPVKEKRLYVVGEYAVVNKSFTLTEEYCGETLKIEDFLELNDEIESDYYFRVPKENLDVIDGRNLVFCWKSGEYVQSSAFVWNYVKLPLVMSNGVIRKITHREVARLKGLPDTFGFKKNENKQWLYRKLTYTPNVYALQQLAKAISYLLNQETIVSSQVRNALRFEDLFWKYLTEKCKDNEILRREYIVNDGCFDFALIKECQHIYFETKFYNNNNSNRARVVKICERLSCQREKDEDEIILVIANNVGDDLKAICKGDFSIHIWDVKNLLEIFKEVPEVLNEFVALLSYSVEDIIAEKPSISLFDETGIRTSGHVLKNRLESIEPGRPQFNEYEEVCTDILQYVFGDYLTSWKKQQKSNKDLYRFDLHCKIKHGVSEEFFETVREFFSTKYIVFEFKNYKEQISQEEVYTTEKYLYEKALRKVAIVISRKGPDENALIAARGCLRESGKLILFLSDTELFDLIDAKDGQTQTSASYLEDKLDEILVTLEK